MPRRYAPRGFTPQALGTTLRVVDVEWEECDAERGEVLQGLRARGARGLGRLRLRGPRGRRGRGGFGRIMYRSRERGLHGPRGQRFVGAYRQGPRLGLGLGRSPYQKTIEFGDLGRAAHTCRRVGKLTAAKEKKLPPSAFGLPQERKYPMPDPSHAKNAKARAKQQLKVKKLSKAKYNMIVRKADRVIARCK